ncbi:rRNA methyltransferase [Candidatus Poribacteria bacterium]|nr:rRNA methyltransferase [Candidatus Poribacteria bacterium]
MKCEKPKTLKVSSENQWFQRAEALKRNRKKRQQYRQFFVEGVQSIDRLVSNDEWSIEAFLYSTKRRSSNWAQGILHGSRARWHLEVKDRLLEKLSDKEETSEILAIAEMPTDDLQRIPVQKNALILLIDRPQSPGNLGTLIRSCDALGAQGIVVTGHAADLYDSRTIRATAGSFFAIPVVRVFSHETLVSWLHNLRQKLAELQIVGTSTHAQIHVSSCTFTRPTILVVGNESRGLSRWCLDLCDSLVGIPMAGTASSLNVACAATAILYEVQRQRLGWKNEI